MTVMQNGTQNTNSAGSNSSSSTSSNSSIPTSSNSSAKSNEASQPLNNQLQQTSQAFDLPPLDLSDPIVQQILNSAGQVGASTNSGADTQAQNPQADGAQAAQSQASGAQSNAAQAASLQAAGLQAAGLQAAALQANTAQAAGLQAAGLQSASSQTQGVQSNEQLAQELYELELQNKRGARQEKGDAMQTQSSVSQNAATAQGINAAQGFNATVQGINAAQSNNMQGNAAAQTYAATQQDYMQTPPAQLSKKEMKALEKGKKPKRKRSAFVGFLEFVIIIAVAIGLAYFLTNYVVKPYEIPSESMEETIMVDDRVLSETVSYAFGGTPQRGDIVTFIDVENPNRTLIKRVIATAGQMVDVREGYVYVDGKKLDEPYTQGKKSLKLSGSAQITYPYKVPDDCIWVMGDNRTNSSDSRAFGAVPLSNITGKAFIRYWPLDRISLF